VEFEPRSFAGCGIAHLPAVVREAQTIGAVSDGAMVGGDGRKQAILKFACKDICLIHYIHSIKKGYAEITHLFILFIIIYT